MYNFEFKLRSHYTQKGILPLLLLLEGFKILRLALPAGKTRFKHSKFSFYRPIILSIIFSRKRLGKQYVSNAQCFLLCYRYYSFP